MAKTVGEVVREIGLDDMPGVSFDFALPMGFVHDIEGVTRLSAGGNFVWLYDSRAKIFGRPYPLTSSAVYMLLRYNREQSHDYPTDRFFG